MKKYIKKAIFLAVIIILAVIDWKIIRNILTASKLGHIADYGMLTFCTLVLGLVVYYIKIRY